MAKSAKQRQAEYRARRKARGLCAYPGCDRKPHKYALCTGHREDAKGQARDRTLMASFYENLLADRDQWRARAASIESDEIHRLKSRVSHLESDLAAANRRKAGYLPQGITGSTRLKPGQRARAGIAA